jgi:hypothetical protein
VQAIKNPLLLSQKRAIAPFSSIYIAPASKSNRRVGKYDRISNTDYTEAFVKVMVGVLQRFLSDALSA